MLARVYVIVDDTSLRARNLPLRSVARGLFRAQPGLVQFRAKTLEARASFTVLEELIALRDELSPGTLIYMNDSAELAASAGADGVHVGQEDLSVSEVRANYPNLRVGVSTHNRVQLERAVADRPDYVAVGPIFETGSKAKPEPVVTVSELARLSEIARREAIPVVAIGGITRSRAAELARWADAIAVIADVLEGATPLSAEQRVLDNVCALGAAMMMRP